MKKKRKKEKKKKKKNENKMSTRGRNTTAKTGKEKGETPGGEDEKR